MQVIDASTSEAAILSRIIDPEEPSFAPEAAQAILALDFKPTDKARMRQLAAKAQEGTLTRREQTEINNYERAGHVLNILQSKARLSLKKRRNPNGKPH